jgi:nucleoside-diphosphate-sugar epimerase
VLANRKILLTGANGYIGTTLSHKLIDAGCDIVLVDLKFARDSVFLGTTESLRVKKFEGDIRNRYFVQDCFKGQNIDTVIHLAGISDGKTGSNNPELTRATNYDSFGDLVEAAGHAGASRFIFASTFGVYGKSYNGLLHEALPLDPQDVYSETKALCERDLQRFNSDFFSTVSLRIAMVYGSSMQMRKDFLVNNLVFQAIENGAIEIQGGFQKRPQIHIQDVSNYFVNLVFAERRLVEGQIFNAVGQNPSVLEIVKTIEKNVRNLKVSFLKPRDIEYSFEMTGARLKKALGLAPTYTLQRGILELIQFYNEMERKRVDLLPR